MELHTFKEYYPTDQQSLDLDTKECTQKNICSLTLSNCQPIGYLKGHSQLWDRADLDTTFAFLKRVYLNPKSNVRVGYI